MLVISVRPGETTTMVTAAGEVISLKLQPNRNIYNNLRLVIDAPQSCTILRAKTRQQRLDELAQQPVFEVSAPGVPARIVVANSELTAVACYSLRYPLSRNVFAWQLGDIDQYIWHSDLEISWLQGLQPPFILAPVEMGWRLGS